MFSLLRDLSVVDDSLFAKPCSSIKESLDNALSIECSANLLSFQWGLWGTYRGRIRLDLDLRVPLFSYHDDRHTAVLALHPRTSVVPSLLIRFIVQLECFIISYSFQIVPKTLPARTLPAASANSPQHPIEVIGTVRLQVTLLRALHM